jgi:sugar-specific transcriptional regulator TrmB
MDFRNIKAGEQKSMSREWVTKTFADLGLSEFEAEIYIYLSQAGPTGERKIAEILTLSRRQVYRSLQILSDKKIVNVKMQQTAQYTAAPLEKVLDRLMREKTKQAETLFENREKLLNHWHSIINEKSSNP